MNVVRKLRNPVLINEWKVRMRSNRAAWVTTLYLLVLGGIVLTFIFLRMNFENRYDPDVSREIFMFLSILQFAMICLFTPGLTAGVISGERERQTLSVLLTTNLTATKLILGKWLASLSFMIYLVLASLPLYGIVFLYGGISPLQLIQVFGLYLVTMLGLGSVGVLFSTLMKRTGISIVLTYAFLFAYTAGTFFLYVVIEEIIDYQRRTANLHTMLPDPVWPEWLLSLNPLAVGLHVFEEGVFGRYNDLKAAGSLPFWMIDPYWLYLLFFVLLTIGTLALSIYLIKPVRRRLFKR